MICISKQVKDFEFVIFVWLSVVDNFYENLKNPGLLSLFYTKTALMVFFCFFIKTSLFSYNMFF